MTPRSIALHRVFAMALMLPVLLFAAANYYLEIGFISRRSAYGLLVLTTGVGIVWGMFFAPTVQDLRDHQYTVDRARALRRFQSAFRSLQSPSLAKQAGNLVDCERLLAGHLDRAVRGDSIDPAQLPVLDEEALRRIEAIKANERRSAEEDDLLGHFYLLQDLRAELAKVKR